MQLIAVMALLATSVASWEPARSLPMPRTEVAAAPMRGEIVVVGGFYATGANSRRVDAFDPPTGTWRRLPNLPVNVDHAAAAGVDGTVYVVGGYGVDRRPLREAWAFDGQAWKRLPLPPEARAAAAATATAAGKLYVVGGVSPRGLATQMLVLDLRTFRWSTAPGPTPREHLAAAAARGLVYAIAGRTAGIDTNVSTVEAWDPRTKRWSARPPVPRPRGGTGAATIGNTIVSVGGEETAGTIGSVYAYDVVARSWRLLPALPHPRHGLGVVAVNRRVWTVAGGAEPGLNVTGVVESLAGR